MSNVPFARSRSRSRSNSAKRPSSFTKSTWLNEVRAFVPDVVVEDLLCRRPEGPWLSTSNAICVLADISGFTSLAERLGAEGPQGPELLRAKLNVYFGKMIDAIYKFGGDVVKFAGDALLVVWKVRNSTAFLRRASSAVAAKESRGGKVDERMPWRARVLRLRASSSSPAHSNKATQQQQPTTCEIPASELEANPALWATREEVVREGVPQLADDASSTCMKCGQPFSENAEAQREEDGSRIRWFWGKLRGDAAHTTTSDGRVSPLNNRYRCPSCGVLVCRRCIVSTIFDLSSHARILTCEHCQAAALKRMPEASLDEFKRSRARLARVLQRCLKCCLGLVSSLDGLEGLRLHVGCGVGELKLMHVGGLMGRWEALVAGDALVQMSEATDAASAGELCISAPGAEILSCVPTADDCDDGRGVRCELRQDPNPGAIFACSLSPGTPVAVGLATDTARPSWDLASALLANDDLDTDDVASLLILYTPGAIREHLLSGQQEFLSEFRRASVVFVNLPDVDYGANGVLHAVHTALRTMQSALYNFEGGLRQFICDDKGTTLIGVFGLFPFAHENDPLLATRCSMSIEHLLAGEGMRCFIGVTTGKVFAGTVGNKRRCEYAVVGDAVNLSARLMVAALKSSESSERRRNNTMATTIFCDSSTADAASSGVRFQRLPPIRVKGKSAALDVFLPIEGARRQLPLMPLAGCVR